jgi:putative endonuclease
MIVKMHQIYPHTNSHLIMFYVYILKSSKKDELYVGSTNDLKRRIIEHNSGKVESTKSKGLHKLVYYESYGVESDARRREKMLKLRGQARNQLILRIKDTLAQNES